MAYKFNGDNVREVKICLVGDSGVGKSSIAMRFVTDKFMNTNSPTIGASFMSKVFPIGDNKSVKFQMWDTAGQERYRSLTPMYYRGCHAAIVVYDLTLQCTFDNLNYWVKDLQQNAPANTLIFLAGNKLDMKDEREISENTGQAYAESVGAMFCEVSAKSCENIVRIFKNISENLPPEPVKLLPLDSGLELVELEKRKCCW